MNRITGPSSTRAGSAEPDVRPHADVPGRLPRLQAWLRAHGSRRSVVLAAIGVLALATVVATALWGGAGPSTDSVADTVPSVSPVATSPAAAPSAAPSADGTWAGLSLPPHAPMADLVAESESGGSISTSASFSLRSLTSMPAVELAAGLVAEPVLDLEIEAGPTADVATVRPSRRLAENAHYRIRLHGPDGALAGSWSFRTQGPLEVVRRLPNDRSTQVPVDTGIEIEFNQDGAMDVEQHFSIDPTLEGRFEVHGRTWAFVPSAPLQPATLYTVTVAAGVRTDGSPQSLESDVRFAFETAGPDEESTQPRVVFEQPLHEVVPG